MTNPEIALLMLGLLVLTIMLGFPIAFTLMGLGVIFGFLAFFDPSYMDSIFHDAVFARLSFLLTSRTYEVMSSDVLTAIPLFLFMGYVVERANIVNRLFYAIQVAARGMPGSMAVAALATCALFATATGIIGAVVTLMGLLALPAMLEARYKTSFAAGVICAGGCLGILIPPSIMLIVYAAASGVSIVQLYAGALFPGFLLAGLYMIYVVGRATLNPALAPKIALSEISETSKGQILWLLLTSFIPLFVLIMAVLGAILFGWASPTEAAAFGAFGGLVLAAVYRALSWERLRESVYLTARTSAMVCWLFVGAWMFSSVFSVLGGHELIKDVVVDLALPPIMFLIVVQLIIFLLGWPLEWSEIIIIFVPIFLPLVAFYQSQYPDLIYFDPLFFGILIALNLQTSFLTPPMAMAAYYLKGVAPPQVQLIEIFKGVMPFLSMVLLAMILLYIFPEIALWLPQTIYGR